MSILCKLGIHDWEQVRVNQRSTQACMRCDKVEVWSEELNRWLSPIKALEKRLDKEARVEKVFRLANELEEQLK